MLHITTMVKTGQRHGEFSFGAASAQLDAGIPAAASA
jgi:hypothetical protein